MSSFCHEWKYVSSWMEVACGEAGSVVFVSFSLQLNLISRWRRALLLSSEDELEAL